MKISCNPRYKPESLSRVLVVKTISCIGIWPRANCCSNLFLIIEIPPQKLANNPLIRSYYTIFKAFGEFIRDLFYQLFPSVISFYSVFGQTLYTRKTQKTTPIKDNSGVSLKFFRLYQ